MQTEMEEEKEAKVPLNVQIPESLDKKVRHAIINLGLNLQRGTRFLFMLALYIQENFGMKDTKKIAKSSYPIVCLKAARNDLEKQGCNIETVTKLDSVINDVEEFLENK